MIPGNIFASKFIKDTVEILEDHAHKSSITYPTQADKVQIAATASAWGDFTNIVEIMSGGDAPAEIFDVHWAVASALSANGQYELKLFQGAAGSETEIAHIPFVRNAVQSQEGALPLQTPRMNPGTRISGALSSDNAVANTADFKIVFHTY